MQKAQRNLSALITVLTTLLSIQVMYAQREQAPHTLNLDEKAASPPASVADLKWLTGHWTGPAFGGVCDEIWSQPSRDSMVGMFRLVKNGKTMFYELITIVEENKTLVMKLKHFNSDMTGWEEKNVSVRFPLVKLSPQEVFFEGLTYQKKMDGSLQIFLSEKQKSGKVEEEEFRLQPLARQGGR
jgi:hypothetical protein